MATRKKKTNGQATRNKHGQTYAEYTREVHRMAVSEYGKQDAGPLAQLRSDLRGELQYAFINGWTVKSAFDGFVA
jgi:hypothetical protein